MIGVDDLVRHARLTEFEQSFFTAAGGFETPVKKSLRRAQESRILKLALLSAAQSGQSSITKLLLDSGADAYDPVSYRSPLVRAFEFGQFETGILLLDRWAAADKVPTMEKRLEMLEMSLNEGGVEITRVLLRRLSRSGVSQARLSNLVPLAASKGVAIVKLLLKYGANLHP